MEKIVNREKYLIQSVVFNALIFLAFITSRNDVVTLRDIVSSGVKTGVFIGMPLGMLVHMSRGMLYLIKKFDKKLLIGVVLYIFNLLIYTYFYLYILR